jgi:hypothetical protein
MKIDMSPAAIRQRLEQVEALRRLCLSLARSSAGREVIRRFPANNKVQRTSLALGR